MCIKVLVDGKMLAAMDMEIKAKKNNLEEEEIIEELHAFLKNLATVQSRLLFKTT